MAIRRPTISLYIPAYNAAKTLGACLSAIARQSVEPDEIIVVDDGSADETVRIARRRRVKLIRHARNRGVAAARNTAIKAAHGELVASLDSDLIAPRDWLAKMLRNFSGRRRIVGCCGRVVEKHTDTVADRWRCVHMKLDFGLRRSYKPRWLYCGVSLIRRQPMLEIGLFDERCRAAYEDVDLSNRLRQRGYTLLYDPTAATTHLKRSCPHNVIRGFWTYWAAKNEMQGAYKSLAAATRLMIERQMGIAGYRLATDIQHRRYELLGLDLLIPLTFCVRDLEEMVRLKTVKPSEARWIQERLVERLLEACGDHLVPSPPVSWARLGLSGDELHRGRTRRCRPAAATYVRTFSTHFRRLLTDLSEHDRRRLTEHLPALMTEARV